MKAGYWISWIPQDKPKEQCSCEHMLPFKKRKGSSKGSSKLAGLPLTPCTQGAQAQTEALSLAWFQRAGQSFY